MYTQVTLESGQHYLSIEKIKVIVVFNDYL